MREGVGVLAEAVGLLGGLLGFLGATGIVLFVLSLLLLALLGAFSPLPRLMNYLAIIGFVTGLALFGMDGIGELPQRVTALRGYLVVMLAPLVVVFAISTIFGGRSETRELKNAVSELSAEVAQLRRERRGDAREAVTLEAEPAEPRMLTRRRPVTGR